MTLKDTRIQSGQARIDFDTPPSPLPDGRLMNRLAGLENDQVA